MRRVRLSLGLAAGAAALALSASTALAAPAVTGANGTEYGPGDTPAYTLTGDPNLVWTLTGPVGGTAATSPASPSTAASQAITVTGLANTAAAPDDGTWTISLTDAGTGTATRTFIWDSEPPPVPVQQTPADNANITDDTPAFNWTTVTDALSGVEEYEIDVNGPNAANSFQLTTATSSAYSRTTELVDGTYDWRVRVIDEAGNTSAWTAFDTFTIATSDPQTPTLQTPAANTVASSQQPSFNWSDSVDAGTGASGIENYDIQLDLAGPGGITTTAVTSSDWAPPAPLANGAYTWRVRARDNAGNLSTWTAARALTIDATTPPAPTLVQTAGAFTRDPTPTFTWSGLATATFTWQVRNASGTIIQPLAAAGTNKSVTVNPLGPDGGYAFEVRQVNAAGTPGPFVKTEFTLDTVAPAAPTLTSLPATPSTNPNPAFAWSAGEPGASFRWQVLNKDLQAVKSGSTGGTSVTVNALPAGNLRFRLWQVDRAGNASSITETAFIITNPKPPAKKPTANFIKPKTRNVKKLKPNVGSKISTATTILRWRKPTRDTVLYNVQVFRMNGRKLIKVHTAFPRGIRYRLPAKLLRPNTRYVWQVWAYRGPEKGYQSKPIGISYFDKLKTRVRKKLLSPKANHVAGKKLVVRWRKAGKSRYYQLQVYRGSKRIVKRRVTKTRSTLAAKLLRPTSAKYRIIIRRGIGAPKNKKYVKKAYAGKSFKVVKPKKKK